MPPIFFDARRNPATVVENVDVALARQYRDQAQSVGAGLEDAVAEVQEIADGLSNLQPQIDGLQDTVDPLVEALSRDDNQVLGRPQGVTLVNGNAGGNFTYVIANPVDRKGPVVLGLYARTTGTLKIARISKSGNASTLIQSVDVAVTTTGEQEHAVPGMVALPGEYLGYFGVGIWTSVAGAADGAGRFYLTTAGAPVSGPISTTPETSPTHQVRLTVLSKDLAVTADIVGAAVADLDGVKQLTASLDTPVVSGRQSSLLVDASGRPLSETTPAVIDHPQIGGIHTRVAALQSGRFNVAPYEAGEGYKALSHPSHLNRWWRALQLAQFKRATMIFCGNSLLQGQRSDNGDSATDAYFRKRGFLAQMRNHFASLFWDVGEGVILNSDPRVTKVGTLAIPSIGITASGQGQRIRGAGQYVEIAIDDADELWAHILWETASNNAPLSYQLNGGPVVQATYPVLTDGASYAHRFRDLPSGSNILRLLPNTADATKQINIEGFSAWNDTRDRGVALHRMAIGGGRLADQFYPTSNAANPRADWITLGQFAPSLIGFCFGANELSIAGQGLGNTPDTYYTLLNDKVTYCTEVLGCAVLLVSLVRFDEAGVGPNYTQQQFYDVHERIATENKNVAHFDLAKIPRWSNFAQASRNNFMFDQIHPRLKGHANIEQLLFDALTMGGKL